MRAASLRSQQSVGEMASDLERALSAIRTVRASQSERREATRIGSQARSAYEASVRMAKLDAVVGPATELTVNGSFLLILLIGGMRVASGGSSVADLVAFLLYMIYLTGPIGSVFQAVSVMHQGAGAPVRINEVLALLPEPDHPTPTGPLVIIAHRFITVRAADQIVVLDRGEVMAIGNHEELLETNGYYRSLATGWLAAEPGARQPRRPAHSR